ncbi:MAG: AAA family ATPase [Phycisphaerales bacterium]|nr:AAA family ATPase [Phycisphaerales bacterium]
MRNEYDQFGETGHPYNSPRDFRDARLEDDQNSQVSLGVLFSDRLGGRWLLALCLAVVLGFAGLIVGWYNSNQEYRSEALIQIDPQTEVTRRKIEDLNIRFYGQYLKTQAVLIRSHRVLAHALTMEELKNKKYFQGVNGIENLREGLRASSSSDTQLILVSFTAPTGVLAEAGVNAVVRSYSELYGRAGVIGMGRKIQDLRDDVAKQERRLRPLESQIADIHSSYHTNDLSGLVIASHEVVGTIQTRVTEAEKILASRRLSSIDDEAIAGVTPVGPSQKDLEKFDDHLLSLRKTLDSAISHFEIIKGRYNTSARQYVWAEERLASAQKLYERQYKEVSSQWIGVGASGDLDSGVNGILVNPVLVTWKSERLESQLAMWKTDLEQERALSESLMQDVREVKDLSSLVTTIKEDLSQTNQRIRDLTVEEPSIERQIEIQYGIVPSLASSDRRAMSAMLGLAGGAFFGFFIVFVIGCFDRRATTAYHVGKSSVNADARCLGVLPDLNQAKEDVDGADVASHCVHQIRNQIEAIRNPRKGYVVTVTSPFQGDGKTSLVMSLGCSYAAAGYRTIVVDCDLVGRSMTRQMGMVGAPGLKEVLRSHHLNGEVRALESHNLSILPVGIDPKVGPESIRKSDIDELFDSLRKSFDIVLVDTGPMTGSLESTPVSVASDGVIMVIRSGGSRSGLEECLNGLNRYGVRYLGTILNCAPYEECYRYVSEASLSAAADARDVVEGDVQDRPSLAVASRNERSPLMLAMETSSRSRIENEDSEE